MRMNDEPENETEKDSRDEPICMSPELPANGEELRQDEQNSMLPIHKSSIIDIEDDGHEQLDRQLSLQKFSPQSNDVPINFQIIPKKNTRIHFRDRVREGQSKFKIQNSKFKNSKFNDVFSDI